MKFLGLISTTRFSFSIIDNVLMLNFALKIKVWACFCWFELRYLLVLQTPKILRAYKENLQPFNTIDLFKYIQYH
jgi:hypothetical protein